MIYFILILGVVSCNAPEKGVRISILEDITETDFLVKPSPKNILPKLGLQDDLWSAVTFSYSTISDVSINKRYQKTLSLERELLGNSLQRKQEVSGFIKEIDSVLRSSANRKELASKNHSSIWKPLLAEIMELQKNTLMTSSIFLFSDLRENSRFWSSYRKSDIEKLQNNFDAVIQQFLQKAAAVKNKQSDHIQVFVVYQPSSIEEDEQYEIMKNLYKTLFKELQISIEFVANI